MAERAAESDTHDEPDARDERIERTVDRVIGRRGLRPRYAAYLVMVIWLIAVLAFGVLQRIVDPHTYPTIWPALWWAVQTVTTVGYGDNVPQQAAGKVVASVLMIGGLAFLSIVTATITSSFVARRQERARARGEDPVMQQLAVLSEQVQGLEAELRRARASDDEVPKSA